MNRRNNNYSNSFSNSAGTDLWGTGRYEDFTPDQRVQILTPKSDKEPKEENQKVVICPSCKGRLGLTTAGYWFCPSDLTTLHKSYDSLPGKEEQIDLSNQQEQPYFKSIPRKSQFTEGHGQQDNITITGTLRKANIKTKGIPNITEEQLRNYFQAEGIIQ